ncbi:hypothetical protein LLG95_09245 [bacterium]|nr:hypothetical protein [bacterium]
MDAISPELLEILVCPETRQKVRPASPELRAQLIAQQQAGQLKNRAGRTVEQRPQDALVREDGQFAYLIFDGIPVMLIEEAIPLK